MPYPINRSPHWINLRHKRMKKLFNLPQVRRMLWVLLLLALLGGYWLLPIHGQVLILTDAAQQHQGAWPQTWVTPPAARPGADVTFYLRDNVPWAHVRLLVDGVEVPRDTDYAAGNGPWTWRWQFSVPATRYEAVFYHDCHTGCIERTRVTLGPVGALPTPVPPRTPTKLGAVFADPARDWHGRAAWTVELTYAERQVDDVEFSIDGLARRVAQARRQGLRVLVRVAYDRQQALPPTGDEVALAHFLDYCAQLARDDRLSGVYGYIIGSGFNGRDENVLSPERPTSPEWYARVFNGYGLPAVRGDNVVQRMRAIQPEVQVLVGSVTPWIDDQDGTLPAAHDVPWLNYFNTMVAYLDEAVAAKSQAGRPLTAPDGFAIQAPGRPGAVDEPSQEPATDLRRPEWDGAQAGFRVYQDWLAIINRFPTTQGRPVYVISTNTWTADTQVPPAQNYPEGWLTSALDEANREPQIQALCWFLDAPPGDRWAPFSLSQGMGRLHTTATEFDGLLQQ